MDRRPGAAEEASMRGMQDKFREAAKMWCTLTIYGRFEHIIVVILSVLIAFVILSATWQLAMSVGPLILAGGFDAVGQGAFQGIFGMIFIVLIALEFEHSLLVVLARHESIVRLRTVLVIAMLATVRKFIIVDINAIAADELLALAAA